MPNYFVMVVIDASVTVEVEADTPEEAAEKAQETDRGMPTACNQCSNDFDLGDPIGAVVCSEDGREELLSTVPSDELRKEVADLSSKLRQREQEREALAAHVEAWRNAMMNAIKSRGDMRQLMALVHANPQTSLAQRDARLKAKWQAEVLAEMADEVKRMHPKASPVGVGAHISMRAKEIAAGGST